MLEKLKKCLTEGKPDQRKVRQGNCCPQKGRYIVYEGLYLQMFALKIRREERYQRLTYNLCKRQFLCVLDILEPKITTLVYLCGISRLLSDN